MALTGNGSGFACGNRSLLYGTKQMIAEVVAVAQAFTRQFVSAKSNKPQITAFTATVLLLLILLITTACWRSSLVQ
jgi:hypothetical protein